MKITRRQLLQTGIGTAAAFGVPWFARAQARPVKLAALLPLTGPFAFAGNAALDAFRDATDYVNEVMGGVGGRKLELIVEDTGYDVAKGTAAFNRVIGKESPEELLFVYGDSTGLSKALAPEIARLGVPYSATSYSSELADPEKYPGIWVFGPTYSDMMEALLRYINEQKPGARIALVYSNSEFGRDPIAYVKQRAQQLGLSVVAEEVTPLVLSDATPTILKLRQARPDFVLTQGYVLTAEPLLVKTAREYGLNATFMGTYYSSEVVLMKRAGPAADGFIATYHNAYSYDKSTPAVQAIYELRASKGKEPGYLTTFYMGAFFVGVAVGEAMRRAAAAGELTRPGITKALGKMWDYDAMGLIRSMRFVNHRLPYTRLYRANAGKGIYEPLTDWLELA